MLEWLRDLPWAWLERGDDSSKEALVPAAGLRAAVAQLIVATGAVTALGYAYRSGTSEDFEGVPRPLAWAPLAVAAVAAAAHLEHARSPTHETATAVRFLNGATVAVGGTLLAFDLLRPSHSGAGSAGALAFASTGILGLALDRHEQTVRSVEDDLRRRAEIVERLVPRRRPKLDRVVVHV